MIAAPVDKKAMRGAEQGEGKMGAYRIAAIPGDGIGQEVIAAGLEVLEALRTRAPGYASRCRRSTGARSTSAAPGA